MHPSLVTDLVLIFMDKLFIFSTVLIRRNGFYWEAKGQGEEIGTPKQWAERGELPIPRTHKSR